MKKKKNDWVGSLADRRQPVKLFKVGSTPILPVSGSSKATLNIEQRKIFLIGFSYSAEYVQEETYREEFIKVGVRLARDNGSSFIN